MEKTIKVNPLPVPTWHWLHMNDSDLTAALPDSAPVYTLSGEQGKLRLKEAMAAQPGQNDWETGMGREFSALLKGTNVTILSIPQGYRESRPSVITVKAKDGQAAGRLLINAGGGSEACVVLLIGGGKNADSGEESSEGMLALQLLVHAQAGSRLKLFVVQALPGGAVSCLDTGLYLEEGAEVSLTHLSLGSEKALIGLAVKLAGDASSFTGDLGARVRSGQSVDINYVSRHAASETKSSMNAWGVLEEGSRKIFRGTIDFRKGSAGSKGAEKEEVLLLGKGQVNQTVPLILCHEEDVEGSHGATVSRLNESMLFYLESRGMDEKTAEETMAGARLRALINRIPDEGARLVAEEMAAPEKKRGSKQEDDSGL